MQKTRLAVGLAHVLLSHELFKQLEFNAPVASVLRNGEKNGIKME